MGGYEVKDNRREQVEILAIGEVFSCETVPQGSGSYEVAPRVELTSH